MPLLPMHGAPLDCVVIGGGPAGLMAALYLARFRRRFVLVDAGASRLLWIPASHNYPGYAHGIHGPDLLQRLREQLAQYDVQPLTAVVDRITPLATGGFEVGAQAQCWQAATVILATGVVDVAPDLPNVAEAIAAGCVRYCPICDGFEASGKTVAVLGRGNGGVGEALFISHYSDRVTLLTLAEPIDPEPRQAQQLDAAGVRIEPAPVSALQLRGKRMEIRFTDDSRQLFDVVYVALGTLVNGGLAQVLGAAATPRGELLVDDHQQTSIDGLYAIGDVVAGLNQIAVGMGQAAIAATAIHNRLR